MIKFLLKASRPRFWVYLWGTFLVGFFAGLSSTDNSVFMDYRFVLFLLYFIFPANLLIYGVNDLSDQDTDKFNSKKGEKEILLQSRMVKTLKIAVLISLLLGVALLFIEGTRLWLVAFLLLGVFYSLPPVRFKMRPFLDSLSNIFYVFPAFIGFSLNATFAYNPLVLIPAFIWPVVMHLYSAIPDIEADKKAGLNTTAVLLGKNFSLWICVVLWLLMAVIVISSGVFFPFSIALLIYPAIPLINLLFPKIPLEKTYWTFPYINFLLGFMVSMLVIYSLFSS